MLHIEQILLFLYVSYIFIYSEMRVNGSKVKITTELLDKLSSKVIFYSLMKSSLLCVVDMFRMYHAYRKRIHSCYYTVLDHQYVATE